VRDWELRLRGRAAFCMQLQDATKKRTDEVDQILAQAKKLLMDE
jgi:hypothetical protein